MRKYLDLENLHAYSYGEECRFQATFKVLDIETGDFLHRVGIEVTGENALSASLKACSELLSKQKYRSLELESMRYLSTVKEYVAELERFRYD